MTHTVTEEIRLDGVGVSLGGRRVLSDVSVSLSERRIAVIGENGSGKSTFARLLNGLVQPSEGSLSVHGIDPVRRATAARRAVGFIFSNPDAQIVMPTVAEDVAFSLRGRGLSRARIAERVAETLADHGLQDHADAPAYTLSGGQKQMLALSSVLVAGPRLVVADEPTTLLDARNTRRIADLLLGMEQQLVLLTHNLALAERCDVALRFEAGRLVDRGDPAEVVGRYRADTA